MRVVKFRYQVPERNGQMSYFSFCKTLGDREPTHPARLEYLYRTIVGPYDDSQQEALSITDFEAVSDPVVSHRILHMLRSSGYKGFGLLHEAVRYVDIMDEYGTLPHKVVFAVNSVSELGAVARLWARGEDGYNDAKWANNVRN